MCYIFRCDISIAVGQSVGQSLEIAIASSSLFLKAEGSRISNMTQTPVTLVAPVALVALLAPVALVVLVAPVALMVPVAPIAL